jgi:nucleotide-binding universal stress UspA family protein
VNTTVKPGSVVVGTDGFLGGDAAVLWAADYAETRHRPLVLLCARRDIAERSFGLVRGLVAELDIEVRTPLTDARQALLELSTRASLVVLGTGGRDHRVSPLVPGSVSAAVSAHASCPVVVVKPRLHPDDTRPGPVVVGVDGTATSAGALALAFDLASTEGVALEVVHNWVRPVDPPGSASYIDTLEEEDEHQRALHVALAGYSEQYPDVTVRRHMPRSGPVETLTVLSEVASIVVVGARHDPGSGSNPSSVSQAVVERAHCTVAVVRS